MKALIDSDYFAYAHGSATDDEGHPLAWPLVASRISQQIENIVEKSGCETYELFLTGGGNFREEVATIKPYKGNRPSEKPYHYQRIRDYLIKFRGATLVEGMEADDAVSIEQFKAYEGALGKHFGIPKWLFEEVKDMNLGTVLCSIDKDLDMVPGWHYNWIKDKRYWVDETDGLRSFYCQLLTGDSVDNIPGLFGVGKASKLLKDVNKCDRELNMYTVVRTQYEKRFGSGYWWQFLLENARLLWMCRTDAYVNKEEEVEYRLECLEASRQKALEANSNTESSNNLENKE